MSDRIKYHDNIGVARLKCGREYLAITFQEPDKDYSPYYVSLRRYCVPGRVDTYHFDWVSGPSGCGDSIRFQSEGNTTLPEAMKLLEADLDKPQVVKMIEKACAEIRHLRYARLFVDQLLAMVGPKTKAMRAAKKELSKTSTRWRKERTLKPSTASPQTGDDPSAGI